MVTVALYVRIEALPGKEDDAAKFLESAQSIVEGEPDTTAWFAIRMGRRPLASSTSSLMTRVDRRTLPGMWRLR